MHLAKVAEPNALHQDLMWYLKKEKSITSKPVHNIDPYANVLRLELWVPKKALALTYGYRSTIRLL